METDSDSNNSDGWEEVRETDDTKISCLFCNNIFSSVAQTYQHCKTSHSFDIVSVHRNVHLDCFSYIKLINFIRRDKPNPETLIHTLNHSKEWTHDQYMIPVVADDPLLCVDVDAIVASIDSNPSPMEEEGALSGGDSITRDNAEYAGNSTVNQPDEQKYEMLKLKDILLRYQEAIKRMTEDVGGTEGQIQKIKNSDEDEAYFSGYAHCNVHRKMLRDKVRTEAYRNVFLCNPSTFSDKVVLDIGCGTGILSLFAAESGAKTVIGIDQSDILYNAIDIIYENGLKDKITLVKGKLENTELPVEKYDILVSEWMGYFLLHENMLDTVLYARDHLLHSDGTVYPDRCSMYIVGIDDEEGLHENITFWDDVYGYKMTCMKNDFIKEAKIEAISGKTVTTDHCLIKMLDIMLCKTADLEFSSPFLLTVCKDGHITALVGYFDVFFERGLKHPISFSTSPLSEQTHWKQTVFYLPHVYDVKAGDTIPGHISVTKLSPESRGLAISINIHNMKLDYKLY